MIKVCSILYGACPDQGKMFRTKKRSVRTKYASRLVVPGHGLDTLKLFWPTVYKPASRLFLSEVKTSVMFSPDTEDGV